MERKLTNAQFADVLRAIAKVYEDNPEIPQIHGFTVPYGFESIYCHSKEDFARTVAAFGPGRKDSDDDCLVFYPTMLEGISLTIQCFKAGVCEKVQVGTRKLPATPERVVPAMPETEVPVYEWRCGAFLDNGAEA